jgi:hypothetical protein
LDTVSPTADQDKQNTRWSIRSVVQGQHGQRGYAQSSRDGFGTKLGLQLVPRPLDFFQGIAKMPCGGMKWSESHLRYLKIS